MTETVSFKTVTLRAAMLGLALTLGGCAGGAPADAPKAKAALAAAPQTTGLPPLGDDEVLTHLGALPPQDLAAGECGLFLWLKRDDAPLVFFQRSDGQAYMTVDGTVTPLDRSFQEGRIALQYFEKQRFGGPNLTLEVAVTPESKRSLQQGLKLPVGSLSVETAAGWSGVLPVVGLIGCK